MNTLLFSLLYCTSPVFKLLGTCSSCHRSTLTALMHIPWALWQSGIIFKKYGPICTSLSHVFWMTFLNRLHILFKPPWAQARVKFYGQNADHFKIDFWVDTTKRKFIECKKQWKMMIRLLKLYLELRHVLMYKQWTSTRKWWFFLKKQWKHTLRGSFYHYKTYENILKFNF